jgi:sugar lactone lactonase YvrE
MGTQSSTTPSRIASRVVLALLVVLSAGAAMAQSPNTPLMLPSSVAYDGNGNLYFAETGNHIVRRLSAAGVLTVVAGTGTQGYSGDLGLATGALLDSPTALAVDVSGDLFIADTHNHRIRRVDALLGTISTYAIASRPVALALNPQGALVYADAATHQVFTVNGATGQSTVLVGSGVQGFGGDGGLATLAMLDTPSGLAFDASGNLYLADAHNHRVRRVDATTGFISTVAGTGLAGYSGDQVAAIRAQLDLPRGLSVDSAGNLFIADSRNQRIRRVDAMTGLISTIAGDGTQGFVGEGSSAAAASLDTPRAVAISAAALPTLADSGNNRIRQVDASQNIQTIAGTGAVSPARMASATTLLQGSSTTLIATVSATASNPTGTATLIDGATPLGSAGLSAGAATFGMSMLSTGSHTLTAAYSGNSALLPSTSQPLIVTIGNPGAADFTLTAGAPTTVSVAAGNAATFNFAVALTGAALTSPINLSVSGAPAGSTASFSPALIPPPSGPSSFTLTIDTPASARLDAPKGREVAAGLCLAALLLPLVFGRRRRNGLLLGAILLTGCGARINTGNSTAPPPLTYNITVSATATSPGGATLLHTSQVTLIVD